MQETTGFHQDLLNQIQDAVVVTHHDLDTRESGIRYANSAFLDLSGYSSADLAHLSLQDLFVSDISPGDLNDVQDRAREGASFVTTAMLRRKDGRARAVTVTSSPHRSEDGHDKGALMMLRARASAANNTETRPTPETGAVNRMAFMSCLDTELRRSRRYKRPFCIMAIDIDDFARINTRYGRDAGDRALAEFARLLDTTLRETDLVAHLTGDTFVALLRETNRERGILTAERLLKRIAQTPIDCGTASVQLRASIGVAGVRADNEDTVDQIVERAVTRGREAHAEGGQIVHATDPSEVRFCGRAKPLWKTPQAGA